MSNPQDERAAFEAEAKNHGLDVRRIPPVHGDGSEDYVRSGTEYAWIGWQLACAALANQRAEAGSQQAEFCYLVELFLGDGTGNSLGWYHTGFTDLGGNSRSTQDPLRARRYPTWREANLAAVKLGHTLQGTWRAVQHGFATTPPSPSIVQPEAVPQGGQWPTNLIGAEGGHYDRPPSPQPPAAQAFVPLTDEQVEAAWRLGFRAAIDAERLNADEEWSYKGANVIEAISGIGTAKPVPERVALTPLTEPQKDEMWYRAHRDESRRAAFVWYFKGIADAERAHGITAPAGGGEEA